MDPTRWEAIRVVFARARKLRETARSEYLQEALDDTKERLEIERMLVAEAAAGEFLVPPEIELLLPSMGQVVGEFTIDREIGRGGMAVVYSARQERLGREVAIKVLPAAEFVSDKHVERFHQEARAAARLRHPGIVPIFTDGIENGLHYFAMELVEGTDFAAEISKLRANSSGPSRPRLPALDREDHIPVVLRNVAQIADALDYAHRNGVIHRDIKPQNLLLGEDGRPRIVDFGMSHDTQQSEEGTPAGGTPHYMSPEQALTGRAQVDHRSDIYSLGVVFYELLTLIRPFEGKTTAEIVARILSGRTRRLRVVNPRIPADVELVCMTAMARETEDRYASAAEFAADLRRILRTEAIVAQPPTWRTRARRWIKRYRVRIAAFAGLLLALLAVVAFLIEGRSNEERRRRAVHLERMVATEEWRNLSTDELASGWVMALELADEALTEEHRSLVEAFVKRFETERRERSRVIFDRLRQELARSAMIERIPSPELLETLAAYAELQALYRTNEIRPAISGAFEEWPE